MIVIMFLIFTICYAGIGFVLVSANVLPTMWQYWAVWGISIISSLSAVFFVARNK